MRSLLSILAFGIGLVAMNRAIVGLAPLPAAAGLRSKVEFAVEHADEYDVLFVGSSATMYGLRPEVFSRELERLGHPGVRAFNLGVGGMGSFEAAHVLRRVLEEAPANLAWVLYEEPLFDPLLWYPDVHNPRYVHWHDRRSTLDAIDALPLVAAPPGHKEEQYRDDWLGRHDWRLAVTREHLDLWLWRTSALGRGPEIFDDLLGRGPAALPSVEDLRLHHGWVDIGLDAQPGVQRAHERFLERRGEWAERLTHITTAEANAGPLEGGYDRASLESLLGDIRTAGAQPLLYVAPRGIASPQMASLSASGVAGEVLRFHLPERYPELNPIELRWDFSHLNAEGAAVWSRLFAREFARHLDATGGAALRR
ncbi:MAG: hypothetical protein P8M11_08860 [Planctomycetota bacterium]|nr:hypothetical protein [Planctomycetota bacterium]MDG1984665.1 hypothetical protein [Planctomycetota bacterium]